MKNEISDMSVHTSQQARIKDHTWAKWNSLLFCHDLPKNAVYSFTIPQCCAVVISHIQYWNSASVNPVKETTTGQPHRLRWKRGPLWINSSFNVKNAHFTAAGGKKMKKTATHMQPGCVAFVWGQRRYWMSMFVTPPLRLQMVRPAFYCWSAEALQHTATRPWWDPWSDWSTSHSSHARTPISAYTNTSYLFNCHIKYWRRCTWYSNKNERNHQIRYISTFFTGSCQKYLF